MTNGEIVRDQTPNTGDGGGSVAQRSSMAPGLCIGLFFLIVTVSRIRDSTRYCNDSHAQAPDLSFAVAVSSSSFVSASTITPYNSRAFSADIISFLTSSRTLCAGRSNGEL